MNISRIIAVMLLGGMMYCRPVGAQSVAQCELSITLPVDGARVVPFSAVAGRISPSTAAMGGSNVWVIVHPTGSWYWVQTVTHASAGEWRANTQFGDSDTPPGLRFEVQAFVAPSIPIKGGDKLSSFPAAACASNLIGVVRQ